MDEFLQIIYGWYSQNKRDLPWRKTKDPYKIWISEIILQQTRVDQGWDYYKKFTKRFPDIETLAAANEEQVLKLWQGLGYYSRARNLHSSARTIMLKHQGVFPQNYADILALKGIGPYTAAAIASIAFNLPYPVLDGNVYRFLARYYGIAAPIDSASGKKIFNDLADELLLRNNSGFHNEALMEFGALKCIPRSPVCENCPLVTSCSAYNTKKVNAFPVKEKKSGKRFRYFCFYLIDNGNSVWMEKRTDNDIWKNLFQFPVVETPKDQTPEEALNHQPDFLKECSYTIKSISDPQKHVLSHQTIFARLIHIKTNKKLFLNSPYLEIPKKELENLPVPRLIEFFFRKYVKI